VSDVTPTPTAVTTSSLAADVATVTAVKDTPTQTYTTNSVTTTSEEEIMFLPDREPPVFYQEIEDDAPRHTSNNADTSEDTGRWVSAIEKSPLESLDYPKINVVSGFDPYLIAYLGHQQGETGIKEILKAAKSNSDKVMVSAGKENINWNMYGKRLNKSWHYSNVGDDFIKSFGTAYTPANFIRYWVAKFPSKKKEASVKTLYDDLFNKYSREIGVPLDLLKTVCNTESSFIPGRHNKTYYGLFQISYREFNKVYPNDTDILTPDKNIKVGALILKKRLASVSILLNSIR
jgi:hypothetical protein